MTEKLFTTEDIASILGMTKQGINKAAREGRIEEPMFTIGPYKGWTLEQVERIKASRVKGGDHCGGN